MNDLEQLAAMDAWIAAHPSTYSTRDTSPAAYEDEDTLRRSRHTLVATSTVIRRAADHPVEPWADSHATGAEADSAWGVAS